MNLRRVRRERLTILFLGVAIGLVPRIVDAQWQLNGVGVSTTPDDQEGGRICSDGTGGAIIAWVDDRNGFGNEDIYAQRVSALGYTQWAAIGVPICSASNDQYGVVMVADGVGGAIIAWTDYRTDANGDVYAQRVNPAGVVMWTSNGVSMCTDPAVQGALDIVADGTGGAIIVWYDQRNIAANVYVQRIDAAGIPQWTPNGVRLRVNSNPQLGARAATDGAGGAIVTWYEMNDYDIYAQRVNNSGVLQWGNGVGVCLEGSQESPAIVSDRAGGAIITWEHHLSSTNWDIYAQRVDGTGALQWGTDNVAICTAVDFQIDPEITNDGGSGAIITWADRRNGDYDIYTQRVDASGVVVWAYDGVPVSTAVDQQAFVVLISDDVGGAIIAWEDDRNGGLQRDVYVQRMSASGGALWTIGGFPICTAVEAQTGLGIVPAAGSAILAWTDSRTGSSSPADIYAQRIEFTYGYWGFPEPTLNSISDMPYDQGGQMSLGWAPSQHDIPGESLISHYSVWRALDAPEPVWEMVGEVPATQQPAYGFIAPTLFDSTAASPAYHHFRIVAHASTLGYEWSSNVMTGSSVDNLAPSAPTLLTAERQADGVHLTWDHDVIPDLNDYAVYRSLTPGKTPGPSQFLMTSTGTAAIDVGAPGGALYYCVTARDVHGNESAPSNEAGVSPVTGIVNPPAVTALTVLQNHPNPFTVTTDFQIGLPENGEVRVEVFDVAGRRVSAIEAKGVKGWQRIPLAARDQRGSPLASGVYFARVTAANATVTKKMVIAR